MFDYTNYVPEDIKPANGLNDREKLNSAKGMLEIDFRGYC